MAEEIPPLEAVSRWYETSFRNNGLSSKSLGWKSSEEQDLRFQILTDHIKTNSTIDVADYGCGFGDLLRYVERTRKFSIASYVGYEINTVIARQARQFLSASSVPSEIFENPEPERVVDWSIASGTFNVKLSRSSEEWKTYVQDTLYKLFERSRLGISFNLLSTYVDWTDDALFYADPGEFFAFCKSCMSKNVRLIHDYPLYEWTIVVSR